MVGAFERTALVLVPKGRNDSSDSTELAEVLEVYCLGMQKKSNSPLGNGMIESEGTFCDLSGEGACRPTQTVPYGTDLF